MNPRILRFDPRTGIIPLSLMIMLSCPAAFAVTKFEQFNASAETAYKAKDYPEAQKNFELAIKESEKMDKADKRIATTVYNLALVFQAEGNYAEAEKNMLKAADMMSFSYGAEHQRVGQVYQDLGDLYLEQSGQEEKPELKKKAAENYKKSAEIFEKIYAQTTGQTEGGEKTPEKQKEDSGKDSKKNESSKTPAQNAALFLANSLRLQADLYAEDELYAQSDPLYLRSLELEEFASGPEDPDLLSHKEKMAEYWCIQSKGKKAEPLFKEVIAVAEKNSPDTSSTANMLYNCGGMYYDQGAFGDAEVYFKRGLKTWEKLGEIKPEELAQKNLALADVLDMQGKHEEAHNVYKKALAVLDKSPDKGIVIRSLKAYQKHLLMQNNKDEAGKIANRIKDLRAQQNTTKQ